MRRDSIAAMHREAQRWSEQRAREHQILEGTMRVEAANRQRFLDRRLVWYRIGWVVFFIVGNYLYFTGESRQSITVYDAYIGSKPLESFGALLLWAAAYFTIKIFFFPSLRKECTLAALALIAAGLGLMEYVA